MNGNNQPVRPPAKKRIRLSYAEHLDTLVGEEKQHFMAYKDEICSRSEFFKAACSEKWAKPDGPRPIELPDENPHIFDIYLHCVYKDKVDVGDLQEPLVGEEYLSNLAKVEYRLVQVWILADKLQDTITANIIMDVLLDFYQQNDGLGPLNRAITMVANYSAAESPLRQLFIDAISYAAGHGTIDHIYDCEDIPKAFVCDTLRQKFTLEIDHPGATIIEIFDPYFVSNQEHCQYHVHDRLRPTCGERCENKVSPQIADENGRAELSS